MSGLIGAIRKASDFINHKLWRVRLSKVDKKQGFLLKQLRIFSLAIKGFNEDKCLLKSTALTYYTLFSIVPIIALAFAIAKGFGYEKTLQDDIMMRFSEQASILNQAFLYANSMLANTQGGIIAGVGIILLLWSVMKLLSSIEESFNEIWEINRARTWVRKITDYMSIMLIAPIFIIISGGLTVLIQTQVDNVVSDTLFSPATSIVLKLIAFGLVWVMFVFLYMALPNTKVNFKSAASAAIVAAILFEVLEWAYLTFQIGAVQYNAIYGSFAALPLFLIWVQYSWFVVMFGAELAFANQNVDHYELENEITNISDRYKRVIALMVANTVIKNFNDGKPALTAMDVSNKLDLPVRLTRTIINEFTETGVFNEVRMSSDKETGYQPGISDSKLTIKYIIDKLDEKGVNHLPIDNGIELATINRLMKEMDDVLNTSRGNMLVKDII